MIIFPVRTDVRLEHRPYVNVALILVNFAVFLLTWKQVAAAALLAEQPQSFEAIVHNAPAYGFYLHGEHMRWYQFFTYQFLHADLAHVGWNMLFLYVFGNSLEDRLGPVGYLAFYLTAGVVAGIGHTAAMGGPVLGASGAVAGVVGAYLALFPLSYVTLMYWVLIIGAFEVHSFFLILLTFFQDVLYYTLGFGQVAYMAHISGNVFGFVVGVLLLVLRIVPRDRHDLIAMIDLIRRRRRARLLRRGGWSDWQAGLLTRESDVAGAARPPSPMPVTTEADPQTRRIQEHRARVLTALVAGDDRAALHGYEHLLTIDAEHALPPAAQLDIAGIAMDSGRFETAARGYEIYRSIVPAADRSPEVELILGLIYGRYLDAPDRARPLLQSAASRHPSEDRRELARRWLADLQP